MVETIEVHSKQHAELLDVTEPIQSVVGRSRVSEGICHVYIPHTTAGVLINENADPGVLQDFLNSLDRLVPWEAGYRHAEGNAAAHIKSSLVGTSQSVPVQDGRLALGRWQGIFLAEFDGPRRRQLTVMVLAAGQRP